MSTGIDRPTGSLLLVGASRGLGAALAGEFAGRGWTVVATVRGEARTPLHALAERSGDRVAVESVDITRSAEIAALRDRLGARRFDMLFVNAGVASHAADATMAETKADEFARVMLTNAFGVMQAVETLQALVAPDGLVGAMSSGQGSLANNTNGRNDLYRSSKAALNQLMKSYAGRHADAGRAVVLMAPGWIRTDMGGPGAPYTVEESAPKLADVLIAARARPGLHYLDRDGRTVSW